MIPDINDPGKSMLLRWIRDHANYPHDDWCLIWPFGTSNGYGSFGKDYKQFYAHRVMCEAVHGAAPTEEHHASHSCNRGDEGCVNPHHVRWRTPSENFKEAKPHRKLKLLPEHVAEIRAQNGIESHKALADRFGVAEVTIRNIQYGLTWKAGIVRGRAFRDAEIQYIRTRNGIRGECQRLADEYGVSYNVIYKIMTRLSWQDVPDAELAPT